MKINLQLTIPREHARPFGKFGFALISFSKKKIYQNYLLLCLVVFVLPRLHCIVIRELIMSLPQFVSWWHQVNDLVCVVHVSCSNICTVFQDPVHTNPSRKRRFSKTLFKPEEFENAGFEF